MLPFESIHFRKLDETTLNTIFENKLSPDQTGFALVFEQGEHRAILSTLVIRPIEVTGLLELTSLFTRPEVRRQGLARRLISETVAYIQENLKRYLYVFVQTVTPYLFERSGFTRTQVLPKPTYFPYIVKSSGYQLKTLVLSLAPRFEETVPLEKSEREDVEVFLGFDEREREIWRLGFRLAFSPDRQWVLVDYGQSPRRYKEWLPVEYFRLRERKGKPGLSFSSKPSLSSAFRKRQSAGVDDGPPAKRARIPDPLPKVLLEEVNEPRFAVLRENSERSEAYSLLVDSLSCVGETHLELCLFNDAEWRFEVAGLVVDQDLPSDHVHDESAVLEKVDDAGNTSDPVSVVVNDVVVSGVGGEAIGSCVGTTGVPIGSAQKTILGSVVVFRRHRQFNFIELAFFATRRELRKSGLGQKLFKELEAEWQKENYEYILTFADFAAVPFFKKLNFSEEPVLPKVMYSSWIDRYNMAELMTKRLWAPVRVEDVTVVSPALAVTVLVGKVNLKRSNKVIRKGWALAETEELVCVEYEVWPRRHREWLKKDSIRWRIDRALRHPDKHAFSQVVTADALMELHPVIMNPRKSRTAKTEDDKLKSEPSEFRWLNEDEETRTFGDDHEQVEVRVEAEESVAWLTPKDDFTQVLAALMAELREEQEVSFVAMVLNNEEQLPLLEELGFSCKLPEDFPFDEAEGGHNLVVADLRVH